MSNARQAEMAYRLAYVSAIEEVQVAMTFTKARNQQVAAYAKATSSAERALNLARRSYEAGVITIDEFGNSVKNAVVAQVKDGGFRFTKRIRFTPGIR